MHFDKKNSLANVTVFFLSNHDDSLSNYNCSGLCHSCFGLRLFSVYNVIRLSLFLGRDSQH